jgi:GUCT (NUC152) domain
LDCLATSPSLPVQDVSEDVVPWFMDAAKQLLQGDLPGGPEAVVARALAKIAGHTQLRSRSLLTAHEDFTTLQVLRDRRSGPAPDCEPAAQQLSAPFAWL